MLDLCQRGDAFGGSDAAQQLPRSATDIVTAAKELERQAFERLVGAAKQHDATARQGT